MRFEIQLILWVTAALTNGGAIFVGAIDPTQLNLVEVALPSPSTESPQNTTKGQTSTIAISQDAALPEINPTNRSLFPVASTEVVSPVLQETNNVLPKLVGIYSLADQLYAVVFDGTAYRTLTREGSVGDYVVVRIAPGEMDVQRKSDGVLNTILLRGAGELP